MSLPQPATETALRLTRVIAAPRAEVFRAWTDPEVLRSWFGPEGTTIGVAEVDLQVGGTYRLRIDSAEGKQHTAHGVYREIDEPSRLVFTWDWEESDHRMGIETVVTVEFADHPDGTELLLTHEGFPSVDATQGHNEGWSSSLNDLERVFA